MANKDFDNLMKVLKVENEYNAGTNVSQEVDFELPRGYIAKIFKIKMKVVEINLDLAGIDPLAHEIIYSMGLWRDPDEAALIQITRGSVQHDGIMDHFLDVMLLAADSGLTWSETETTLDIPEHIDLITARNMRFNSVAGGADVASAVDAFAHCTIYYTLERVTDADILELLDIL